MVLRRLAVALVLFAPAAAAADTASPAETAFREGRDLMAKGDLEKACAKLAESQRLEPAAGTLLNLAECQEKRGLTASAWATYEEAAKASRERGRADWEKLAVSKIDTLSKIAPRVTYAVTQADLDSGIVVEQDAAASKPNLPLPVDPGSHTVKATAAGHAPFETTYEIRNGDKLRIAVTLGALEKEKPRAIEPVAKSDGDGMRTLGLVLGVAGIAALTVGGVTGLMAISRHDEAVSKCTSYPDHCPADGSGSRANDEASTLAAVSTITFIAGGALLAGGAVLYLTAAPKKTTVALAPTLGGVSVAGRF